MPLAKLVTEQDIYFSEPFKVIVRSCKEVLLEGSTVLPITDRSFLYAHRNNFYAWLRGIGFDERLIWVTAFINDIKDPTGDISYLKEIRTVTIDAVDSIILPLKTKYAN